MNMTSQQAAINVSSEEKNTYSVNVSKPTLVVVKMTESVINFFSQIKKAFQNVFRGIHYFVDQTRDAVISWKDRRVKSMDGLKSKFSRRPRFNFKPVILVVLLLVGTFVVVKVVGNKINSSDSQVKGTTTQDPVRIYDVNQSFDFPVKDEKGNKLTDINFEIDDAEIVKEIVVQGQKAKAIEGRSFLILNLKITNPYEKSIALNSRNYLRMSVNGENDVLLTPDIHNDPVEIQAISTKKTRLGFPISDSDHDFILKIGEIEGDKTEVKLFTN